MNELLTRPGFSGMAHNGTSPTMAREMQRNRLCELRRAPGFEEWRRLTLALGPEDCLLLLAGEVAATSADSDAVSMAKALLSIAQRIEATAGDGDDHWMNPLFPLPLPEAAIRLPVLLPTRLDGAAAGAVASAD
jgi:hypothetical protein